MLPSIIARMKACSGVKNEHSRASSRRAILRRITPRAISASALGLRSPAMIAVSMARPETPWMSLITAGSFRCVLQQLLAAFLLRGAGLDQPPAVAGVRAQPPDLLRGHEAAGQRPLLGDPRQPGRVQLVGLRPSR